MNLKNYEKTIIDELKICYTTDNDTLKKLENTKEFLLTEKYILFRCNYPSFQHGFSICSGQLGNHSNTIAHLYFAHITNPDYNYIFLRIENEILYKNQSFLKDFLANISIELNLSFHHFTHIDVAKDFKTNKVFLINRMMKNTEIATIINGKWKNNPNEIITELKEFRSRTLTHGINPELVLLQKKSQKNKYNGIIVVAYNKLAEIQEGQSREPNYKQYILDYYNRPQRSLHRLEVRLARESIEYICQKEQIDCNTTDILFEPSVLDKLFYDGLFSVIHFSTTSKTKKGEKRTRNPIPWEDIL